MVVVFVVILLVGGLFMFMKLEGLFCDCILVLDRVFLCLGWYGEGLSLGWCCVWMIRIMMLIMMLRIVVYMLLCRLRMILFGLMWIDF